MNSLIERFEVKAFVPTLVGVILLFLAPLATAADPEPFTDQRFSELTSAGKNVVLNVHATWCPTCKRQQPVLLKQMQESRFKDFQILIIDWDTQGKLRRRFNLIIPSTLVVFKGPIETGREVGLLEPEKIAALLDTALK